MLSIRNITRSLLVYLFKLLIFDLTLLVGHYLFHSWIRDLVLVWILFEILFDFLVSLIVFSIDFEVFRVIEIIGFIIIIFLSPVVFRIIGVSFIKEDSLFNIISIIFIDRYIDISQKLVHFAHEVTMFHIELSISIIDVVSK